MIDRIYFMPTYSIVNLRALLGVEYFERTLFHEVAVHILPNVRKHDVVDTVALS